MTDKIYGSLFAIFMFIVVILWATFIIERLYPSEHKQNKQRIPEESQRRVKKGHKKGKDYLSKEDGSRAGTGC